MSWMLKHKEFGIYQGSCLGMGFWHPMSEMPEQGIAEFETKEEVEEYVNFLTSDKCSEPLKREDLEILEFDQVLNKELLSMGLE